MVITKFMDSAELRSALVAAFPATALDRAAIGVATSQWDGYEERDALSLLEDKTWVELAPADIERHAALLVYASPALYRAVLPAYLLRIAEQAYATSLPFGVLGQLVRKGGAFEQAIFDERVGPMTAKQRRVVLAGISMVAEQELLREAATQALSSWNGEGDIA